MRNHSLWEVHGAERKVFDTRVTLFSADGKPHLLCSIEKITTLIDLTGACQIVAVGRFRTRPPAIKTRRIVLHRRTKC